MRAGRPVALFAALVLAGWLSAGPASGQEPGRKMPDRGGGHVSEGTPISYPEYPPTSGPHWPPSVRWGAYREAVPEELFVHNLEHGGIVILYRCQTPCPDLVRQLESLFKTLPPSKYGHVKVVISPNNRIGTRLALLAWTRLDELDRFDPERVVRFVRAWQDKGPEDIP